MLRSRLKQLVREWKRRRVKRIEKQIAAFETLEPRLLLTVDPGDDLTSALWATPTPGVVEEHHQTIGDGFYPGSDVDLYQISLNAGDVLDVDVDAEYLDDGSFYSILDSHLRIFDNSGAELANNADGLSPNDSPLSMFDSFLSFTAATGGVYFVGVSSAGNETYDPSYPSHLACSYTGQYVLQLSVTASGSGGNGGGGIGANEAPTANDDSYTTQSGTVLVAGIDGVLQNDADPDGDLLTASLESGPSSGTLNYLHADGSFEYLPNLGFSGLDSFQYTVTDPGGLASSATVFVAVTAVDSGERPPLIHGPNAILVTGNGDEIDPDDPFTTLREAVAQANENADFSEIVFDLDVPHVVLTSDQPLVLSTAMSIRGQNGYPITIELSPSSTSPSRILQTDSEAEVELSDLVIRGGRLVDEDGAGIWNAGELNAQRVVFESNATDGRGGAIYNAGGLLQLTDVTLRENTAGQGAGIYSEGMLVAESSVIHDNVASSDGGAVHLAPGAVATLTNLTVSGNQANDGAGIFNAGSLSLRSTTIANNVASGGASSAAGISNVSGNVDAVNTLVAGNDGHSDIRGVFQSLGHNLFGIANEASGLSPSDQTGVMDPLLGPLQDNGGATWTHHLLPGSPAIDAGSNTLLGALGVDQRGAPRILDGPDPGSRLDEVQTTDIGALELGTFFVNTAGDRTDTSLLGDGSVDVDDVTPGRQVSARGAIQELVHLAGWDGGVDIQHVALNGVVIFEQGLDTILLTREGSREDLAASGDLDIYGDITLRGDAASLTTIDAGWGPMTPTGQDLGDRIFHVLPGSRLRIEELHVRGGHLIEDSSLQSERGGAIYNDAGTVEIVDSVFGDSGVLGFGRGGSEAKHGGFLYTREGDVSVQNTVVQGHRAADGGALYVESGTVSLSNTDFYGNAAEVAGGAIYVRSGALEITNESTLSRNDVYGIETATSTPLGDGAAGGAIFIDVGGNVVIDGDSRLIENQTHGVVLSDAYGAYGTAIYSRGELLLDDVQVDNNGVWDTLYGAIYNEGLLSITDSTVDGNQSGALINSTHGTVNIRHTSLSNNQANHWGSTIYNDNGVVSLSDSVLKDNFNPMTAPGVFNYDLDAQLTVINTTFDGNNSESSGGGITNHHGSVRVVDSTFVDNWMMNDGAWGGGGAILNMGQHRFLGNTPASFLQLAAAVNPHQTVILVEDVAPIEDLPLPLALLIDDEQVTVTEVDPFLNALTVNPRQGTDSHSVTARVTTFISEDQTHLTLADPGVLEQYQLPLDIVVDFEVMTVIDLQDNLATVVRGRNGTVAREHYNPVDVWGVSGSLEVVGSTFVSNRLDQASNSGDFDAGGAIFNLIQPFVSPTVIENSTFDGNVGHVGAAIFTDIQDMEFKEDQILVGDDGTPRLVDLWEPEENYWSGGQQWTVVGHGDWQDEGYELPTTSLIIQNSVISDSLRSDGVPWMPVAGGHESKHASIWGIDPEDEGEDEQDVAGEQEEETGDGEFEILPPDGLVSGGGNLIDADMFLYTFLEDDLPVDESSVELVPPEKGFPDPPFVMRISQLVGTELVNEEVLVTGIADTDDSNIDDSNTDGSNSDDSNADDSNTDGSSSDNSNTEGSSSGDSSTDDSGTEDSGAEAFVPGAAETITLNITRGFNGTEARKFRADLARITVSHSGFHQPGDRFGTLDAHPLTHVTQVVEPDGISSEATQFIVADTSNFPETPFEIHVSHEVDDPHPLGDDTYYERMTVTSYIGNRVTVERGAGWTDPIAHPDRALIEIDDEVIDRLDPGIGPLVNYGGPTAVQIPLRGGELLDRGRNDGFVGRSIRATDGLGATYGVDTEVFMALGDQPHVVLDNPLFPEDDLVALEDVTNLPAAPFLLYVNEELMQVNSVDLVTNFLSVDRGVGGTEIGQHDFGTAALVGVEISPDSSRIHYRNVQGFPSTPFLIDVGSERMRVIDVEADTQAFLVERGVHGTAPAAHSAGTSLRHGTVVEVDPNVQLPEVPFLTLIGDEQVRVTEADAGILVLERGAKRTQPDLQRASTPIIFDEQGLSKGFHGRHSTLSSEAGSALPLTQDQITIAALPGSLPAAFTVRVHEEEMRATVQIQNADGTATLAVVRGFNDTTPTEHPAGSAVLLLVDQQQSSARYVDSSGDEVPDLDIGASEAIVFTVNTWHDLDDQNPGNGIADTGATGTVSLRAAVTEANALQGHAVIVISDELQSAVRVENAGLEITGNIRIVGQGADRSEIFHPGWGRLFTIAPEGQLHLEDLTVHESSILVDGGSLRGERVVIMHGDAAQGGAVANDGGSVLLVNSTLHQNWASTAGGAVWNSAGGHTELRSVTLSDNRVGLENSELSDDLARGGAISNSADSTLVIRNSTITLNDAPYAGGIDNAGTVEVANTIVAGNTADEGTPDAVGIYSSRGGNLIGINQPAVTSLGADLLDHVNALTIADASGLPDTPFLIRVGGVESMTVLAVNGSELAVERSEFSLQRYDHPAGAAVRIDGFWEDGDQVGDVGSPLDPLLEPLALSYSGVPTHALQPSSPALDAGVDGVFAGPTVVSTGDVFPGTNRIQVSKLSGLPDPPFAARINDEVFTVIDIEGYWLVAHRPQATSHQRDSQITIMADQRGAPRFMDLPGIGGGTAAGGGSTGGSGDTTTDPGDTGTDTGYTGDDAGQTGTDTGNTGTDTGSTGTDTGYTGDDTGGTGTDTGNSGTDTGNTGSTGDAAGGSGDGNNQNSGSDSPPANPHVVDIGAFELVPILSLSSAQTVVAEGNVGEVATYHFELLREGFTGGATEVDVIVLPTGDAPADPTDFVGDIYTRRRVTFSPGQTIESLTFEVKGDRWVEGPETFQVDLRDPSPGAWLVGDPLEATILDDDVATVIVAPASADEGQTVTFEVSVSNPVEGGVEIAWTTSDVTADSSTEETSTEETSTEETSTDGSSIDYVSGQGVTRAYGTEPGLFYVPTLQDRTVELDETFQVTLVGSASPNVDGLVTFPTLQTGTIVNDDTTSIRILNVHQNEGDTSDSALAYDVVVGPNPVDVPIDVSITPTGLTATEDVDFAALTTTLTLSGSADETSTQSLSIHGDVDWEADENIALNISASAAGREADFTLSHGLATLADDDSSRIIVNHITQHEDSVFGFAVHVVNPLGNPISVDVMTVDGSATAGEDYTAWQETFTFSGTAEESHFFSVPILGDSMAELDETFQVALSNLSAAGDEAAYEAVGASGLIVNDDQAEVVFTVPSGFGCEDNDDPRVRACVSESEEEVILGLQLDGTVDSTVAVNVHFIAEDPLPHDFEDHVIEGLTLSGAGDETIELRLNLRDHPSDVVPATILARVELADAAGRQVFADDVVAIQLTPPEDEHDDCKPPVDTSEFRNVGTPPEGDGYLPIPVLLVLEEYQGPDGLAVGRWLDPAGNEIPSPGWHNGVLYAEEVPSMDLAVPGDIGFGRDMYGFALIPQLDGEGKIHLMGSVDQLNYGTLLPYELEDPEAPPENGPAVATCEEVGEPHTEKNYFEFITEADWTISPYDQLTVNPFDSFNFRLLQEELIEQLVELGTYDVSEFDDISPEDLAITVTEPGSFEQATRVGGTVELTFGGIQVNDDLTVTYIPRPAEELKELTELIEPNDPTPPDVLLPELNADGRVVRYTGLENFELHLTLDSFVAEEEPPAEADNSAESDAPATPADPPAPDAPGGPPLVSLASTTLQLAVSNHLPVFRGDGRHIPDGAGKAKLVLRNETPRLDGRVDGYWELSNLDFDEIGPLDKMRSEYIWVNRFDLDGPVFIGHDTTYRIDLRDLFQDPDDGDQFEIVALSSTNGLHSVDVDVEIGQIATVDASGFVVGDPTKRYLQVRKVTDTVIEITNPLTDLDVNPINQGREWQTNHVPTTLPFSIFFTDGQTILPPPPDNPDPNAATHQPPNLPVYHQLTFQVRPNTTSSESLWRNGTPPEHELRPWITEVDISVNDLRDAAWRVTPVTRTGSPAMDLSQVIGNTLVDLETGTFQRHHGLILDGSGGQSEMSLPGLVYDSATVQPATGPANVVVQALVEVPTINGFVKYVEQIDATLRWFDHVNTSGANGGRIITSTQSFKTALSDDYLVSMRPAEAPIASGLYGWELELKLHVGGSQITLTTSGQTPVIVAETTDAADFESDSPLNWSRKAAFGAGWQLADVPSLHLDYGGEDNTLDDRILLSFPGESPRLFDLSRLTLNDFDYDGLLDNLQLGTSGVGIRGFADPLQFGTLKSKPERDELVYNDGFGTEYVFKRFDVRPDAASADTTIVYLIDRIEPVDVETATAPPTAKRKAVIFDRYTGDTTKSGYGRLENIISSDGVATSFLYPNHANYEDDYVQAIQRNDAQGNPLYNVEFSVDAGGHLTQIRHDHFGSGNDRLREFSYDDGFMTQDRWFGTTLERHTEFSYSHDSSTDLAFDPLVASVPVTVDYPPARILGGVTMGHNPTDAVFYEIRPAAIQGLGETQQGDGFAPALDDLRAVYEIRVDDLERFDESLMAGVVEAGTYRTEYALDVNGWKTSHRETFQRDSGEDVEIIEQSWRLDVLGQPKVHTDPDGVETFSWRDYEDPTDHTKTDSPNSADTGPKYDPNDYHGNVTFVLDGNVMSVREHETDDEEFNAHGLLVRSTEIANITPHGAIYRIGPGAPSIASAKAVRDSLKAAQRGGNVTNYYRRSEDGRPTMLQTVRGINDFWTLSLTAPNPLAVQDEPDRYELWTYDGDGLLTTHQDSRGLTTGYAYDLLNRLRTVTTTDQGAASSSIEVTSSEFTYDAAGFVDGVTSYYGPAGTNPISHRMIGFDASGRQTNDHLLQGITTLSHTTSTYSADGTLVETRDAFNVPTVSTYDTAGRLIEQTAAQGEMYYALYTGSLESVEQTTSYAYYADGTLKEAILPNGTSQRYYRDPLNWKRWETTDRVSSGDHQTSGPTIDFNFDGLRVVRSTFDHYGRTTQAFDLLTDKEVTQEHAVFGKGMPNAAHSVGKAAATTGGDRNYDARGNTIRRQSSGFAPTTTDFNELNHVTARADLAAQTVVSKPTTDASGDVLEHQNTRFIVGDAATTRSRFTAQYDYDQQGRVRQTLDPLQGIESNIVPTSRTYQFDTNSNLRHTVSVDRVGSVTEEWIDGLGRVVRSKNAQGAETEFTYDAVGNLVSQVFAPAAGDSLPPRETLFRYDALGRQRAVIERGDNPFFTATDYFAAAAAGPGSADFHVVQFNPVAGDDPHTATVSPDSATRTVMDSLGNPVFVLAPENVATLNTYDYYGSGWLNAVANTAIGALNNPLFGSGVTSRTSVAGSAVHSMDMTHDQTRISRTIYDIHGNPSVVLQRVSDVGASDAASNLLVAGSQWAFGEYQLVRFDKYNEQGQLVSSTDGRLHTTDYEYDAYGNVKTVTRPDSSTLTYRHYSTGQVRSETDERGNTTTYSYDAFGRPLLVMRPTGHVTQYTYAGPLTIVEEKPASPAIISSSFHNIPAGIKIDTDPTGATTTTEYDSAGNVVRVEDGRGNETEYEYDRFNRLVKTIDALDNESTIEYDFSGNVVLEKDVLDRVTQHDYDELNRKVKSSDARGGVTTFTYDVSGNLIEEHFQYNCTSDCLEVHDPIERKTTHEYDRLNQLVKTIAAAGTLDLETTYGYDLAGNLLIVEAPEGQKATYQYDALNRRTHVHEHLDSSTIHTTTTEYLDNGGTVKVTNAEHNVTETKYDAGGRVISVKDAEHGLTTYHRDEFGNLQELIDPGQGAAGRNTTTFEYDELHRVISQTNELGDTRRFYYDANGNREFQVDRNGRVIQYVYDELNRLDKEEWIDASASVPATGPTEAWANTQAIDRTLDFDYDEAGRVVSASDPSASYSYDYDLLDALTDSETNLAALPQTIEQVGKFDAVGNRIGLTLVVDGAVDVENTYEFDDLNRMTSIQQGDAVDNAVWKQLTISYDDAGRYDTISRYVNDLSTLVSWSDYDFDAANRLIELNHYDAGGTTAIAGYRYDYDDIRRVTAIDSVVDGNATFTYDDTDQLKTATFQGQADESYTYDKNGNRQGGGHVTDANNRLKSDGDYDYEYDAEGNRTAKITQGTPSSEHPTKRVEYEWDHRNRLTKVTFEDDTEAPLKHVWYQYDAFDRRILKEVDNDGDGTVDRAEHYVYEDSPASELDGIALIFADEDGEGPETPAVDTRFLHGPEVDQIFASENADGEVLWHLADHQGSVRDIVEYDDNTLDTKVVKHVRYGAFGNIDAVLDAAGELIENGADDLHHAYTGREWDADAELYYYRARWYDGEAGRFASEDPLGFEAGDVNLNRYVGNESLNSTDPSGLVEYRYHPHQEFEKGVGGQVSGSGRHVKLNEAIEGRKWVPIVEVYDGYKTVDFSSWSKGEVEIAITGKDTFDQGEADRAFRQKYGKDKPADYTFHHDGRKTRTVIRGGKKILISNMQAVPSVLNLSVPHKGSASFARDLMDEEGLDLDQLKQRVQKYNASPTAERINTLDVPRQGTRMPKRGFKARGIALLEIYHAARDLGQVTGVLQPDTSTIDETYKFEAEDGSEYIVREVQRQMKRQAWYARLLGIGISTYMTHERVFVDGTRKGEVETISEREFEAHREEARRLYGVFIKGNLFRESRFKPGDVRKTLPLVEVDLTGSRRVVGYVDDEGEHRNMKKPAWESESGAVFDAEGNMLEFEDYGT